MSEMLLDLVDIFNISTCFCIAFHCIKYSAKIEQTHFSLDFLKVTVIEYNLYIAQGLSEKVTFSNVNKKFQPEEMEWSRTNCL